MRMSSCSCETMWGGKGRFASSLTLRASKAAKGDVFMKTSCVMTNAVCCTMRKYTRNAISPIRLRWMMGDELTRRSDKRIHAVFIRHRAGTGEYPAMISRLQFMGEMLSFSKGAPMRSQQANKASTSMPPRCSARKISVNSSCNASLSSVVRPAATDMRNR